ncbi:hypothetical protein V8C86DRAFT_3031586 [Haematococcus lacustris]
MTSTASNAQSPSNHHHFPIQQASSRRVALASRRAAACSSCCYWVMMYDVQHLGGGSWMPSSPSETISNAIHRLEGDKPYLSQATPGDLGKWVDRDCNVALNLQRAGESKWRPLELCRWQYRGRLPAQGKEYPALGFKMRREQAPKALAQQPVAQ